MVQKEILQLGSFMAACVLVSSALTLIYWGEATPESSTSNAQALARDYQRIPFDEYDAVNICNARAEAHYGSTLFRTHIDEHSTRLEDDRDLYLVVLQGFVKEQQKTTENTIYCYIDTQAYAVNYFKVTGSKDRPRLSSESAFSTFSSSFN